MPFSPLFYIWNTVLFLAMSYDLFMVPFSIALNFDFYGAFYVIDIIAILVYCIDIFMRAKTAITSADSICFDKQAILHYYVNSWLIMDLLACIPFEYFIHPFTPHVSIDLIRYVRLFRLFKTARFIELMRLIKIQSDFSGPIFKFMQLFAVFALAAHMMACTYIFIGYREVGRNRRFDGQTLFSDMLNRDFITLKPAVEMGKMELYWQFYYLSSCTMGAVMYGDIIPYTFSE